MGLRLFPDSVLWTNRRAGIIFTIYKLLTPLHEILEIHHGNLT